MKQSSCSMATPSYSLFSMSASTRCVSNRKFVFVTPFLKLNVRGSPFCVCDDFICAVSGE